MNIGLRTYSESLVLDDTVARKVNSSDASEFARICKCCPSRGKVPHVIQLLCPITWPFSLVWGFIWLVQAIIYFALGIIIGLLAFKVSRLLWFFLSFFFFPVCWMDILVYLAKCSTASNRCISIPSCSRIQEWCAFFGTKFFGCIYTRAVAHCHGCIVKHLHYVYTSIIL